MKLPRPVAYPHLVGFGTRLLLERLLKTILAQSALSALPSEVESTAEVGAGVDVGVMFVECRVDAASVESQQKGEAAHTATNDGDARLGSGSRGHGCAGEAMTRLS